jgi:hypothetical protein
MILEGLSVLGAALVGIYMEIAYVFFPLIIFLCAAWLVGAGRAGISWPLISFIWFIVAAFLDGRAARKGRFGMARENPDHPHRRYDRMFLLLIATLPLFLALRLAGHPMRWAVWGTVYFSLLAAVDTFLREPFDRIPRGILRRRGTLAGAEVRARLGLCADCTYVQPAVPVRKRRPIRCALSVLDARFQEYPMPPVPACEGFRPQPDAVPPSGGGRA